MQRKGHQGGQAQLVRDPHIEVQVVLLTHKSRAQQLVIWYPWCVVVQHLHVCSHRLDELLKCACGGMADSESDNGEKQAEPLELGMHLVEHSWDVHGLVVPNLMDLSQIF
jgi:hypothetical protein